MVLLAFNYVERHALGLLLQDIKTALVLSDTQLGVLTGIAFALFYSVLGIPLARWSDRHDRVNVIAAAAALSGLALAACGLAANFLQLLIIRVGVAVGEAGSVPPAHSLIAEFFDRTERTRAFAIYQLGVPLSTLMATASAGWLDQLYGWRITFMLLGLPGVGLGLLARLTLREPRRGLSTSERTAGIRGLAEGAETEPAGASLLKVFRALCGNKTFRSVLIAYSVGSFFSSGIAQWNAAFFIRSYGFRTGELGTWLASIWGFGGLIGVYAGGALAARYAAGNEALQLKGMAVAFFAFGALSAAVYASPNSMLAFTFMGISVVGVFLAHAPLFATIQTVVPNNMRAMSIALIFLFSNLVGLGLGPLAVGALSDALHAWAGQESLRYALLILSPGYTFTAWFLWRASRTVASDIDEVDAQGNTGGALGARAVGL
jgi:MFS family permease